MIHCSGQHQQCGDRGAAQPVHDDEIRRTTYAIGSAGDDGAGRDIFTTLPWHIDYQ
jgi:hypothetical protein